jgi:uncharacterized integral membrane protein (TIGR00697 family)
MVKKLNSSSNKLIILLSIFLSTLICGNLLGNKIITLLGVNVSVGIFAYPITFLITDIVEEAFGKKETLKFIKAGIIALLISLVFVTLARVLPPASFYTANEAYNTIFGNSLRIIIASLVAFLISQYHDIWAFNFWKKLTHKKHLWLRNNLSTMVSQGIDSIIFMFIAFFMITPEFTVARIMNMIWPYWLLKIGIAALDTPLCYLGVNWIKSGKEE